jgi:hypothetical protein
VHGGISLLSRSISGWTPCKNSTTVNALVAFMLDGLQLADVRPASHEAAEAQRRRGDQPQQQGGPLTEGGGGGGGGQGLRVVWALRSTRAGMQAEVLQALQQRIPQETGAQVRAAWLGRACPHVAVGCRACDKGRRPRVVPPRLLPGRVSACLLDAPPHALPCITASRAAGVCR